MYEEKGKSHNEERKQASPRVEEMKHGLGT